MTILKMKTDLYEHQQRAFQKLSKIKVGALYMEMGTGKTRTALELCLKRVNEGKVSKVLWLCPCSVKNTIEKEISKHVDGSPSLFEICGIETLSSSIKANARLRRLVHRESVFLVVDESNLVKNHKAIRTRNITELSDYCKYKLILNGTPISRNEADLFAQWKILDWRILGYRSFWSFSRNHIIWDEKIWGKIRDMKNTQHLVKRISPYTYQIRKSECITLPEKTYKTYFYSLTPQQREHYDFVANELLFELDKLEPHTIYRLFTGLQNVISGFRVKIGEKLEKTHFFQNPLENPRVEMLLELIERIGEEKILIFCKYTREIYEITELLNAEYGTGSAVPFSGEVSQKKRQLHKELFSQNARFLVANKTCAGYGLNLQFCSYAIFYNNDWDYATRGQAEDRIHRIGQTKNVHIMDICADGTLDERILACLSRKENLVESFKKNVEIFKNRKDFSALARAWVGGKEDGESL